LEGTFFCGGGWLSSEKGFFSFWSFDAGL